MRNQMRGFTLTELVITLVIVAILGTAVAPVFVNALHQSQLNACTEQLAAHLRYARKLAMEEKVARTIYFTLSGNFYEIMETASLAFEPDPLDESKMLNVDFDTSANCKGITMQDVYFPHAGGHTDELTWDASGRPRAGYDTGSPVLSATGGIRLRNQSGKQITLYVTKEVGSVMIGRTF